MANHLTPQELSQETGLDESEIIRICEEEGIPFRNIGGKIDKTLFRAQLEALGAIPVAH